ncbi:MAG: hypothetical protein Ta2A_11560 [Treponemataceae bacterium]|nr:MAG: hypothetical protein Ta2A_11560 [Treponemataceae bacterium]
MTRYDAEQQGIEEPEDFYAPSVEDEKEDMVEHDATKCYWLDGESCDYLEERCTKDKFCPYFEDTETIEVLHRE